MTIVEWLKKILRTAIFVGLTWAIFYFAGKFWGFLWLGFWAFFYMLLLLVAFGFWRDWWGYKIYFYGCKVERLRAFICVVCAACVLALAQFVET